MPVLLDEYWKNFGNVDEGITKEEVGNLKYALDRAYQIRNFEIDNYWKRAAYFWGFQVAIFAAFALLFRSMFENSDKIKSGVDFLFPISFTVLGGVTALAAYLSARGSKFWQQNWEKHIDVLEKKLGMNLHRTVWVKSGGVEFSVSRINQRLSFCFFIFWFFVFCFTEIFFVSLNLGYDFFISFFLPIILFASGCVFVWKTKTDLNAVDPCKNDEDFDPGRSWPLRCFEGEKFSFVLRKMPDDSVR